MTLRRQDLSPRAGEGLLVSAKQSSRLVYALRRLENEADGEGPPDGVFRGSTSVYPCARERARWPLFDGDAVRFIPACGRGVLEPPLVWADLGLSPRAQERRSGNSALVVPDGFIPPRAGKAALRQGKQTLATVYPRARGKGVRDSVWMIRPIGLSLRARGRVI